MGLYPTMPSNSNSAGRSRKWCFTMFFDCDKEPRGPGKDYFGDNWECEYLIVGYEICPKSNRPHYQGYVRFANPRALSGVRKLFTHTVTLDDNKQGYPGHWTPCKGTEAQNFNYCTKAEDIIVEFGIKESSPEVAEYKHQGKRNDIDLARNMIKAGAGMHEITNIVPSYQAMKCAEMMLKYMEVTRNWQPEIFWIWGPTGVGKSKFAFDQCKDPWVSGDTGKWFEGYDAHEDVIIDDIRGDFCKFHVLLRLLDRYPYRIEVKGGSRQFLAKRIFITSCHPPHKVYKDRGGEDLKQLGRRIAKIIFIESLTVAWEQPGSDIGIEPAIRFIVPAQRAAQEVGGNTTGPRRSAKADDTVPGLKAPPTSYSICTHDDIVDTEYGPMCYDCCEII